MGLNIRRQEHACTHSMRHMGINLTSNWGGGWNAGRHSNTTGAESLGLATPVSMRQVCDCRITPPKTVCGTRVANQLLFPKSSRYGGGPESAVDTNHDWLPRSNFPPIPLEPIGRSKLLRDMVWGFGRLRHFWPYTFLIVGAMATVAWTAILGYALVTLVLTVL